MTYPKALKVEDLTIGRDVILFMTSKGKERERHGNEFDKWCVPASVESVDENIVTVRIDDLYIKLYGYTSGTVSFAINNRFHEVGKTVSDFRLFLCKGDAYRYEHFRVVNKEYHEAHKEKRNQAAREYQTNNADYIRKRKKKYRHDNRELVKMRQERYYAENKERIDEYQRKYKKENRDAINRKQREARNTRKKKGERRSNVI